MGGQWTRKRVIAAVAAVAVAAALVAGTAWVVRGFGGVEGGGGAVDSGESDPMEPEPIAPVAAEDIDDVSISMDAPTYDLGSETHSGGIEITVDNDSGTALRGVALDVVIEDPGGGMPPMAVAGSSTDCGYAPEYDDPDSEHPDDEYIDEECLRQQRKGEQGCTLSLRDDGSYPNARHSRCVQTLEQGENRFSFETRVVTDNAAEARGFPEVTATARLSVGGEEFASTEEQLKTKYPKEWDRARFDDFPKSIDTDRTESDPYRWSVMVTNDSGKPLTDAEAFFFTEGDGTVGFDGGRGGCHRDVEYPDNEGYLLCEGIDLPAGGRFTMDLTAYFIGDVGKLKKKSGCRDDGDTCGGDTVGFWIGMPDERVMASIDVSTTIRLAE